IRETYNIPRDENRKLRDYPTLAHVIQFVYDKRPDLHGAPSPTSPTVAPSAAAPGLATAQDDAKTTAPAPTVVSPQVATGDSVKERVLALMAEKTGYPIDMLDLDLDLEADLGVDTVKQAEMFAAVREIYHIPRDENRKLRDYPTLAHVIRFVLENRPDLAIAAPAAPPAGEPASAPLPAATDETSDDAIKEKVLDIVADKTGYPKDMLDLDLDMEADLGIDTVKQAEMFAAVRAAYNIPRDETLKLRDFPTLAHVIEFAHRRRPSAAAARVPVAPSAQKQGELTPERTAAPQPPAPPPLAVARRVPASLSAANGIPRRVPVPNLRPALTICKPTGVTLGPGRRVVIMPDQGGVAEVLAGRLRSLGIEALQIEGTPQADALADRLKTWLAAGPVHGVYWLPALDFEGKLSAMDLAAWHEALRVRVKSLYVMMRTLYDQVATPGTFLVSATRLGGQHGYDEAGAVAPLGGAVTGFTKTYKRERPDAFVKAVDFHPEAAPPQIAELLIGETQRDPGALEIGYKSGQRWTVGLQEQPAADGRPGQVLDQDTVFLITGAAGSIVSAITADLAAASGGEFYLLDLVPEPSPGNPDLKRFVSDKDGLKRDLFARIQARGERATPALVEKELAALERAHAAQSAIDAVRAAGGTAHYFSVNLADAEGVAGVIREVRKRSGRIDVLLHAAGIDRSHFLPEKDPREFDAVFDVKSDGWFNLMHAIGDMPLGTTVAFSSIAARFGNRGQTDYSAANDLLCKLASNLRTSRPSTRAIAIDWTAWGGMGMAARGSIPKIMEMAGIQVLPPEAGVPVIRRELTAGRTSGEVVIGQRLGVLLDEWDPTGGLEVAAADAARQRSAAPGPMVGNVAAIALNDGLTLETTLNPAVQPFLHDHQIDGTPVLPGVMGIEAFAEAARWMLPEWQVEAVEDVKFLAPFKFYRSEPRTLTIQAVFYPEGDAVLADCRLTGSRALPSQAEPQITTHFTGRVRLTRKRPEALAAERPGAAAGAIVEAADIYRAYFHGPAYRVLERAWRDGGRIVGEMAQDLPLHHQPAGLPTLMAPRLVELCFQTAGLWEMGEQGRMGLPSEVDRVCLSRAPESAEGRFFAVVTPDPERACFDAEVVDVEGHVYARLTGYRTAQLPYDLDPERTKALQALASPQPVMA
ncbi:MAG TPA: SDR family NAD(P)-dependent oxidoreductase, partial [Terriglobia bacterium]|nr:SDR family NAD(P)-dependent oxidoreductase [Terriglobia bacterium]